MCQVSTVGLAEALLCLSSQLADSGKDMMGLYSLCWGDFAVVSQM